MFLTCAPVKAQRAKKFRTKIHMSDLVLAPSGWWIHLIWAGGARSDRHLRGCGASSHRVPRKSSQRWAVRGGRCAALHRSTDPTFSPHSGPPHARCWCMRSVRAGAATKALSWRPDRDEWGVPDLFSLQQGSETVTRACGRVFPSFSICVFHILLKVIVLIKAQDQNSHTLHSLCFTYNMNFSKRNDIKYLYSQPENISQHTRWFIWVSFDWWPLKIHMLSMKTCENLPLAWVKEWMGKKNK